MTFFSGGQFFGEVALESDGCCLVELGEKRCNEVQVDLKKVERYFCIQNFNIPILLLLK